MREHIEPLARRGVRDAVELLTGPPYPRVLAYLIDWYAEFTLWHDWSRAATWADWQAWSAMMRRAPTPFDLRVLRQIHLAYSRAAEQSVRTES